MRHETRWSALGWLNRVVHYALMNDDPKVEPDAATPQDPALQPTDKVDPAALGMAGLAAIFAFTTGPGDWGILSLIVGLAFTFVLLGYHETCPNRTRSIRAIIRRLAFAWFLALSIGLCFAWPIQSLILQPLDPTYLPDVGEYQAAGQTTMTIAVLWFPLTAVLAWQEPRLAQQLDRGRGRPS